MIPTRPAWLALLVLALAASGCGEQADDNAQTKPQPIPSASDETGSPPAQPASSTATAEKPAAPADTSPEPAPSSAAASQPTGSPASAGSAAEGGVTLEKVKYDEMLRRIAANPTKAKYTMVDAWATWCGPCKENFPHVVQMHEKYGDKGLAVASLSLDDPADAKAYDEARKFLAEQKATFPNYLLDEETNAAFDKLNVNGIPAVFLFGPDGKEIKRFTGDDPNNQFTYDEVEKTVAGLLGAK
jgi:thiol-disulfide isomerase/thioredoxin